MTNSLKTCVFATCLVVTNAATWVMAHKFTKNENKSALSSGFATETTAELSAQADTLAETYLECRDLTLSEKKSPEEYSHQAITGLDRTGKGKELELTNEQNPSPLTNPPVDVPDNLIDSDASFQVSDVNAFNKNAFQYDSHEQKIQTLEALSSNGDDLEFVRLAATSDNDPEIKIAAIKKLNGLNNYAAVNTLMASIDDKSPEVAITALTALVATNDRSLLPMLKDKYERFEDGAIKTQLSQAIQTLEYTPAFSMDEEY